MTRRNLFRGTRDEILAELNRYARDALLGAALHHEDHPGKGEAKARLYARAIAVIEDGGEEVEVRHTIYRVSDDLPAQREDSAG